jgi:hypothetical protein
MQTASCNALMMVRVMLPMPSVVVKKKTVSFSNTAAGVVPSRLSYCTDHKLRLQRSGALVEGHHTPGRLSGLVTPGHCRAL